MDSITAQRLEKKYSSSAPSSNKKELSVMGRRPGGMGMQAGGKPKNTLASIKKLLGYLSEERKLFVLALICALICAVFSLVASYLLRPIMNEFIYYDAENADISVTEAKKFIDNYFNIYLIFGFKNWRKLRYPFHTKLTALFLYNLTLHKHTAPTVRRAHPARNNTAVIIKACHHRH